MKTDNEIDLPNPPQGYKWVFDAALDCGFGCSLKAVRIQTNLSQKQNNMKTEQKLEVYRELFGLLLPIAPDGKELVGIEYGPPKLGDYYYDDDMWIRSDNTYENFRFPVAIFKDTHREDGTPLSIDPLPEVEGYRVEYVGEVSGDELTIGEDVLVFDDRLNPIEPARKWHRVTRLGSHTEDKMYFALIYKIAQPTTLADLVGEDGQKNFYCIYGGAAGYIQGHIEEHGGELTVNNENFEKLADEEIHWSHSPFTKYEDANEFFPE